MLVTVFLATLFVYINCDDYDTKRARILDLESKLALGGNMTISDKETAVNKCLMEHKFAEVDQDFQHPEHYKFSHHFFKYKDKIKYSNVYKIIKAMPKGALLHVHDKGILGPDYMLNITYMDNLYVCFGNKTQFWFSYTTPNTTCPDSWQLMKNVRCAAKNITKFDSEIRQLFTMVVENPDVVYPTIYETWKRFGQYFGNVFNLFSFKPVLSQYLYDVLTAFREDNIMYAELRSNFKKIYDLNGTIYNEIAIAKLYKSVIDEFVKDHPDFYGVKIILVASRSEDTNSLLNSINTARKLSKEVPELIAGIDIVGREDIKSLLDFTPILDGINVLDFFFHAGETNWFGQPTDENLVDAVLLGTKRIGHAYALTKHPIVMKHVIEKDIALEVNVISNAVLSLVRDVRNHPLSVFLSLGLPVVLSSDDPGVWEAEPLSDDFYVAFVAVASRSSDLRLLKTLALNSLKYSALNRYDKDNVIRMFHVKWDHFIDNFHCSFY